MHGESLLGSGMSLTDRPFEIGSLLRVVGAKSTSDKHFYSLTFLSTNGHSEAHFLDFVNIKPGSTVIILGYNHSIDDEYNIIIFYDGLIVVSFYAFDALMLRQLFEQVSAFNQCYD